MRFILEIEGANGASYEDTPGEVARLLRDCAGQVEDGIRQGLLRDLNGNHVGSWQFGEDEEDEDRDGEDKDDDRD
jgi:hypothetical protein